jgi:solute carrier family 25 phosphate transporter 23/24/25/41
VHRLPYSAINFFVYERLMTTLSAGRPGRHRDDASAAAVGHRLLAGAGAGMCACAATYPLDLVRTRLAAQTTSTRYLGLRHALATIHAEEGARGLYRGLGATLVGVAPSLAINFATYETLRRRAAAAAPGAHPAALALAAGSAAGAVSAVCCFPLDLVRRRMQLADSRGDAAAVAGGAPRGGSIAAMPAVARRVLQRDGMRGFYRGIVPELGKVVPGVGIAFSVYEFAKRQLGCDS